MIVAPPEYPGKKYRCRYAYEHHVVYWRAHGIVPTRGEVVHHVNENKRDNAIGNLELKTVSAHNRDHHEPAPIVEFLCGWCGAPGSRKASEARTHLKNSKSGKLFCSRSCGAKRQNSQ